MVVGGFCPDCVEIVWLWPLPLSVCDEVKPVCMAKERCGCGEMVIDPGGTIAGGLIPPLLVCDRAPGPFPLGLTGRTTFGWCSTIPALERSKREEGN